jgi:pyridoxamine 5'-phosphate oxidase
LWRAHRRAVCGNRHTGFGGGASYERITGMDPQTLAAMRRGYPEHGLDEKEVTSEPFGQFGRWFADAVDLGLVEPNAMVLATVSSSGMPSSRMVLLKAYDEHGFVFFTNYRSRKAREIAANPAVCLLFPWQPMRRQVIVTGRAARVPAAESAAYFRSRPWDSQVGAWASDQSAVIESREQLDERYAMLARRWPEGTEVPVPDFWGGFRVAVETMEFWQGRSSRLHDRLRYRSGADEGWTLERLAP